MKKILTTVFGLTVIDAALTCIGMKLGYIEEANPLLQDIFNTSPELASFVIIAFVGLMLMLIFRLQYRVRWIKIGLKTLFIVKLLVLGLHFEWIVQV